MRSTLEPNYLRRLVGIFGTIFAIYVVFLAFLVLVQRQLMYFPDDIRFSPTQARLEGFTELNYVSADGIKLHGFFAPPKPNRKLTIVFFQGNAQNLGVRVEKIKMWRDQGYGVMLATYRGFEKNEGSPSETGLYQDARSAIEAIRQKGVPINNMIIYGESLGTGIAVEMAAEMGSVAPPAGVVLEVPYTSIPEVGAYRYPFVPIFWMLWDRYESVNKMKNIKAPVLILQAGQDKVIPPIFAKKLFEAAQPPKSMLTNIKAGHMEIYSSADIVKSIFAWMGDMEKAAPLPSASAAPVAPPAAQPVIQQPVVQQAPAPAQAAQPAPATKHRRRN